MTEKQKQAIRVLNTLHERKFADDEEYFLLLEFVMGIPEPIINVPFQRLEPMPPYDVWYKDNSNKNHEPNGLFGPTTCTDNANKVEGGEYNPNETLMGDSKPKKELSYGEKLIMENKSPI